MTELLALHQRTENDILFKEISRPAPGIPNEPLPGWKEIRLDSKLPMLKIPDKKLTFTRNKVGQPLLLKKEPAEYDPYSYVRVPEYDSLHDPHLKKYYSRKKNLEILRQAGRINTENDVICTLKDLNEYRQYLHTLHASAVTDKKKQMDKLNMDAKELQRVQEVAENRCKSMRSCRDRETILKNKRNIELSRNRKFLKVITKLRRKFRDIEDEKLNKQEMLKKKAELHSLIIARKQEIVRQNEEERVSALKRRIKMRKYKLEKFQRKSQEENKRTKLNEAIEKWNKKVVFRQMEKENNENILDQAENNMEQKVKKHHAKSHKKWKLLKKFKPIPPITSDLKRRQKLYIKQAKKACRDAEKTLFKCRPKSKKVSQEDIKDNMFENCRETVMVALKKISRDLSKDRYAVAFFTMRINNLFKRITERVYENIRNILHNGDGDRGDGKTDMMRKIFSRLKSNKNETKLVTFGDIEIFETSNTDFTNEMILKSVKDRPPTPKSSIGSLDIKPNPSTNDIRPQDYQFDTWSMEEKIAAEHYYVTFKKSLIVGIEKKIFIVINFLRQNYIIEPRKEILELDRKYLIDIMSKSILTYHINSSDFYSNLRLCISFVLSDIINEFYHQAFPWKYEEFNVHPYCRHCQIPCKF